MGVGDRFRSVEFCYFSKLYVFMPVELCAVVLDEDIIVDLVSRCLLRIGPSLIGERISHRSLPRSDPPVPWIYESCMQKVGQIWCSLAAKSYQGPSANRGLHLRSSIFSSLITQSINIMVRDLLSRTDAFLVIEKWNSTASITSIDVITPYLTRCLEFS